MDQNDGKRILDQLVFEGIERIARFSSHLEEIRKQFYNDEDSIVKDKLAFINSYEDCLIKYFELIIAYQNLLEKDDLELDILRLIQKLELIIKSINDLHLNHLIHLPRPNEPIELRRFGRVIKKQIFNIEEEVFNTDNPISIYINEQIGEVSYATDPLEVFKKDNINTIVHDLNFSFKDDIDFQIDEFGNEVLDGLTSGMHITISRIDANNPCHWPSLLHEVSHNLMRRIKFTNNNILEDFNEYVKDQNAFDNIKDIEEKEINLKYWLSECWCDLIACASIGPSFYFSQFHLFLNYLHTNNNNKYPPFLFRLKLIEKILYHRFGEIVKEENFDKSIELTQKVLEQFERNQKHQYNNHSFIRKLFSLFKEYFLNHLFKIDEEGKGYFLNAEFNSKFQKTIRYVIAIEPKRIEKLTENLGKGFPIPSYVYSIEPYCEKPTSVQEILFAAWNYRNGKFKDKILGITKNLRADENIKTSADLTKAFKDKVRNEGFSRFDQSVLRSIQVSEWFDALYEGVVEKDGGTLLKEEKQSKRQKNVISADLLVDWQILESLKKEEIFIIPLMSLRDQRGSTSIDIRLGTTFELYSPNQFGILDFTENESIKKIAKSAQKINLDFPEPIAINPGQFILGHSMEYIKLPDTIVADLEGRSSFARLGIEIHMTAGFIDPGFEGVLTFEIFNAGPSPVKLYPGVRVGQLRFTRVGQPDKSYSKKHTPKYAGLLEYYGSKQNNDPEVSRITKIKEDLKFNKQKNI